MAAGTAYTASYNVENFTRLCRKITGVRKNPNLMPAGVYMFDSGSQTVAATNTETAADELFSLVFPGDCFLIGLQVQVSDLDSNGAPAIVFDVNAQTSAGVNTTLINDTTIGQAGGYDELDANVGAYLLDVSNQKLGFKIVTGAATAVAGTVRYKGLVYIGPKAENF